MRNMNIAPSLHTLGSTPRSLLHNLHLVYECSLTCELGAECGAVWPRMPATVGLEVATNSLTCRIATELQVVCNREAVLGQ